MLDIVDDELTEDMRTKYQIDHEKGYLIDTVMNSQDNYSLLLNYFFEE